jgi:hypothetical protein
LLKWLGIQIGITKVPGQMTTTQGWKKRNRQGEAGAMQVEEGMHDIMRELKLQWR